MDAPIKKILTDGDDAPFQSFDTSAVSGCPSLPPDLALQLRNVGSRVRRSVSQGYVMTPHSFTKHNSTGALWQSEKDTLRDVYSNSMAATPTGAPSLNKRGRSMFDDSEEGVDKEASLSMTALDVATGASNALPHQDHSARVMKPLRKGRRAISDSVLDFGSANRTTEEMPKLEEEDWSLMETEESNKSASFQPVSFE